MTETDLNWVPDGHPHWQRLYLVTDGTSAKVGLAKNPVSRLSNMNVGSPTPMTMPYVFRCRFPTRILEKALHAALKEDGLHIRGEWYFIHPDRVVAEYLPKVKPVVEKEIQEINDIRKGMK